ncbi:MAG TPA: fumarylacetoacetate hydrolase family protein [Acidimicrobiales bacterium]|nr:fumarylacetoacetate hydrolase family protein [Acidimicrobiales bacterium]
MQLARLSTSDGPRMVVTDTDLHNAHVVTIAGNAFDDLPALLAAADGDIARIEAGAEVQFEPTDLVSVVGRPRKVICIGLNYRGHAAETKSPLPEQPILFPKWDNALTGPYDDVPLPPESTFVDWEAELAFVFGRRCRRVNAADAASVVFGFTAANDLSMRDFQMASSQWAAGKSWDRGTAVGPVVVDTAAIGTVAPDLAIVGRRNGQVTQDSRTNDLIFGVPALVEYITTVMTMEPGDIVLTGTPSGVGMVTPDAGGLQPGDVYEVEIEGIGTIRNRFVAESDWVPRAKVPAR